MEEPEAFEHYEDMKKRNHSFSAAPAQNFYAVVLLINHSLAGSVGLKAPFPE